MAISLFISDYLINQPPGNAISETFVYKDNVSSVRHGLIYNILIEIAVIQRMT